MSETQPPAVGSICWQDITVDDAESLRRFYSDVVGWQSEPQEMGGYQDFNMLAPDSGQTVAGICHGRGENAKLPPQWLIYITVADVERSAKRCVELGGQVVDGPRAMGGGRLCVIRDPAGAVAALFSAADA